MIYRCALLILFLNCVRTIEDKPNYFQDEYDLLKFEKAYRVWPFMRDVPHLIRIEKREADGIAKPESDSIKPSENLPEQTNKDDTGTIIGQSEGESVKEDKKDESSVPVSNNVNSGGNVKQEQGNVINLVPSKTPDAKENVTTVPPSVSKLSDETKSQNSTKEETVDVNSPGVIKRALIVFGGLTLLAVAYLIFYRNKHKKFDANNAHGNNESNQFRYGVLQSDDRRENLELSRIPLTMESDDDDDEDLEIFDLEQKRKSLSYVNLQANDEDIVLRSSKDESKNNLLLDIEDGSADQLINWSTSGIHEA